MTPKKLQGMDLNSREVEAGVVLFKRARSEVWQARIRRTTGKWIAISTKMVDFEAACRVASDRKLQIDTAQKTGQVDVTRRFKDVAALTVRVLQEQLDAGVGKSVYRDYIQAINGYLVPCFGGKPVHTINHADILRLDQYRRDKLKRVPNKSTITTHNAALNKVFATAIERGFMLPLQVPTLVNHGRPTLARPYFNHDL